MAKTGEIKVTVESPHDIAIMRQNKSTATAIREVLGLPNDAWNNLRVEYSHGEIATATVDLFISREQAVALAELLTNLSPNGEPDV